MVEELAAVYAKDETYSELLKEADLIYDKLSEELSDEQAETLEQYFEAIVAASARRETLTYIEGMKNLFSLFQALSKD